MALYRERRVGGEGGDWGGGEGEERGCGEMGAGRVCQPFLSHPTNRSSKHRLMKRMTTSPCMKQQQGKHHLVVMRFNETVS